MNRRDPAELLTLRDAADELGCHYMTLYRRVRGGELPASLCAGSYRVRRGDLERWLERRPARGGAAPARSRARDWPRHAERLHALLLEGRAEDAQQLVLRLVENGADPVEACERAVAPAMARIGEDWAAERASEADEHRATAIVEGLVVRLGGAFATPGPRRGGAVVATPSGERHGLPAALVACALRAARFTVHQLGSDLPAASIARLAAREQAHVAALSCSRPETLAALAEAVAAVTAEGIPVLVGGRGLDAETARGLGAGAFAADLAGAQAAAARLVAASPAAV